MAPEIVSITEAELPELHRVCSTAFGEESTADKVDDERPVAEYDRMIGVSDNGQLVASASAYSFRLTTPGLGSVGAAGVSWVGVLPTHRRQGLLRRMMAHQLDDVAEREEPVAVLTASEATIYGRFGYGVGAQHLRATIDTKRAGFVAAIDDEGSIELHWSGDREAVAAMAEVYDGWRRTRPGALSQHEGWWEIVANDKPHHRPGRGPSFYAIHLDDHGTPDGYAHYTIKNDPENEGDNVASVGSVVAVDPVVDAALWRYLLDLDLTKAVVAEALAVDDPLKWRLEDPRALTAEYLEDWLWVRVLDVTVALEARSYDADGELVLAVEDPFRPGGRAEGTFRLEAGPDGATCERAGHVDPDIILSVEALGSAWLGATSMTTLARAGRASGEPEALALADRMFQARPAPFCNIGF